MNGKKLKCECRNKVNAINSLRASPFSLRGRLESGSFHAKRVELIAFDELSTAQDLHRDTTAIAGQPTSACATPSWPLARY